MKIAIEVHHYAPELNKVFVTDNKGNHKATIPAPGVTSIRAAREKFFQPVKPGKVARLTATYRDPQYSWLDSNRAGRFNNYADLMQVLKQFKAGKQGGPLLDGTTLETPKIKVKISLIG